VGVTKNKTGMLKINCDRSYGMATMAIAYNALSGDGILKYIYCLAMTK
jgi:hypothetical protein